MGVWLIWRRKEGVLGLISDHEINDALNVIKHVWGPLCCSYLHWIDQNLPNWLLSNRYVIIELNPCLYPQKPPTYQKLEITQLSRLRFRCVMKYLRPQITSIWNIAFLRHWTRYLQQFINAIYWRMDREAGRVPSCTIHEMKGNNAPLHHVPSIVPVGQYTIDDDLLVSGFHLQPLLNLL